MKTIIKKILPPKLISCLRYLRIKKHYPTFVNLVNQIRITSPLVLYSIGARDGLSYLGNYLREKGIIRTIGFEPDSMECGKLVTDKKFDAVFPIALGDENTVRDLYITQNRGCSSLLVPNIKIIKQFSTIPQWFEVEKVVNVWMKRACDIIETNSIPPLTLLN